MKKCRIIPKLQKACAETGWSVTAEKQEGCYCYEIEKYTTAGQDVVQNFQTRRLTDVYEIALQLENLYRGFDVDEEAYNWIGPDGHGKNGAPYHIKDI